jgi:hypothetical protein
MRNYPDLILNDDGSDLHRLKETTITITVTPEMEREKWKMILEHLAPEEPR